MKIVFVDIPSDEKHAMLKYSSNLIYKLKLSKFK